MLSRKMGLDHGSPGGRRGLGQPTGSLPAQQGPQPGLVPGLYGGNTASFSGIWVPCFLRQASFSNCVFHFGAELRGRGRTWRGSLITLVWKRADRVTSSLVHSVDLCVPRVSSVVGRYLKGALAQGCPWRWAARARGARGTGAGHPTGAPGGSVPPPLGAGCRPLGPHRGARSPRERGYVEGRPILADLLWVRGRQRLALPWATEGLAPAPAALSL